MHVHVHQLKEYSHKKVQRWPYKGILCSLNNVLVKCDNNYTCTCTCMYIYRVFFRKTFSEGAKPNFQEIRGVKLKYIKFMQYIHLVHVPLSALLSQRT